MDQKLVTARPFRALGHSMVADCNALLASGPTTPDALPLPQQTWPPGSDRCLPWPRDADYVKDIIPGDVGVFDIGSGRVPRFRKLGDMRADLDGVDVSFAENYQNRDNNVYR